jgi:hypothetical protein
MGFEPLREEEASFFKNNKIATPARVTSFNSTGGKKQPTIEKNWMSGDTGMGKQAADRDPDLMTYVDNSYNLS